MGKPGRRPLGRLRFRRQDNIKVDVHEINSGCRLHWCGLA
jgi:hypothetical protein